MRFLLPPTRGLISASARAALLADWMSDWLEEPVQVEIASSYRQLIAEVELRRAAVAWTPPAVRARITEGVRATLIAVRQERTSCRSALIVRKDSAVATVSDLDGRIASWVDPLSTSGYLQAACHLAARDLTLAEQHFAGSYRAALERVVDTSADVTSMYVVNDSPSATLEESGELAAVPADTLRVVALTDPAPHDALTIGQGAPPGLESRIEGLRNDRHMSVLLEVCGADRFEPSEPITFQQYAAQTTSALASRIGA